jgi:hypothetical protein
MTTTIYAFSGKERAANPTREGYLAAVAAIVVPVVDLAFEILGTPSFREPHRGGALDQMDWYGGFVDVVNEVFLSDDEAVQEILGFSPNLYKLRPNDARDAVESARLAEEFTPDFFGQVAYRVFELDLWDAIEKLFIERHGLAGWKAASGT